MFQKLKTWLSKIFAPTSDAMMSAETTPETLQDLAAELVTRSRLGDQVAMAQMCLVREHAEKGHPGAKRSMAALTNYVKRHPIESTSRFGDEIRRDNEADRLAELMFATMGNEEAYPRAVINLAPEIAKNDFNKAIVTLANGPSLLGNGNDVPIILAIANSFTDDQIRAAFARGVKYCENAMKDGYKELPPECQSMVRLGFLLGSARKIQAVRLPNVPISALSPEVGWELGEGADIQ
jgi:hypothetical protein